jgi:catechol-2,3-dioxygenase
MKELLPVEVSTIVLDSADHKSLSDFYLRMLGWEKNYEDEDWIDIKSPSGGVMLGFQNNPDYVPPVWPEEPKAQQQMLHIDFKTGSAEQMRIAVEHAVSCGAARAKTQFSDKWTVMTDPAGHPFCFVVG